MKEQKQKPINVNDVAVRHVAVQITRAVVWQIVKYLWWFILFFMVSNYVRDKYNMSMDNSDRDGLHRSGMVVRVDYATGINYLETTKGGITPRITTNGTLYITH